MPQPSPGLFRREAVEHHAQQRVEGDLLWLSPRWTSWAYWLVVVTCVACILFVGFGRVREYAAGPAVLRLEGRVDVMSTAAAIVEAVEASPGQHVERGAPLVRVYLTSQVEELQRTDPQFDLTLPPERPPAAGGPRSRTLEAQRDIAEARLVRHVLRAPEAGTVTDVRVRPGQHVATGEIVVSLEGAQTHFSVVGILPGHFRPLLRAGMPLRLALSGYPYQYQYLVITSVGARVVGPAEVRRYLGLAIGDAVPVEGPAVVVRARVADETFAADAGSLRYYDGMQGVLETPVRRERILLTLVPGLRAFFAPEYPGVQRRGAR